jgi:hypothetical protein
MPIQACRRWRGALRTALMDRKDSLCCGLPASGTTESADESSAAQQSVVCRPLDEHQGTDSDGPSAGSPCCQPGAGAPLLGDRQRDPGAAKEGHRAAGEGPPLRVSSDKGLVSDESSLYARVFRSLAGRAHSPTGCWTNSLGAQCPAPGSRQRSGGAAMVYLAEGARPPQDAEWPIPCI